MCACGDVSPDTEGTGGTEETAAADTEGPTTGPPAGPRTSTSTSGAPTDPGEGDSADDGSDSGVETPPDPPPNLVVDHTWVDRFDDIPSEFVEAAANTRMFFMDRSVGGNIDEGLGCLASSYESAPNHCVRAQHPADPAYSVDESVIAWSGSYDRSNWAFEYWPENCGGDWAGKVECFIEFMQPQVDAYDVVSFQLSYLAVVEGSDVADAQTGFFVEQADRGDVWDYVAFGEASGKTLIHWTTSLARGIGTPESDAFNDQMRQWTAEQDVPLFDVADILCHDPDGNPCYDNRDGIPYTFNDHVEDHPDDGVEYRAICPHYTTELDGGHLGSVSAGKIRVAKAFWVLMARIAGWPG